MSTPDQSEPPVLSTHNGYDVYPMPMFATIETADVQVVSQWYQDALGFGVMFQAPDMGGLPMLVHLRRRKYQDLLVRPARPAREFADVESMHLYFQAGGEIDALAAQASAVAPVGRSRVEAPVDTPWNTREVHIVDPDGRRLVFSHPRFDPEASERMRKMLEAGGGGGR